jgi:hypothetical protein
MALYALAVVPIVACQRVPLLAPSGSTITLTSSVNTLAAGGSTPIIAQVIEPAGTPPHSGTHVTFTTTLGTVQPSEAETDANGQAVVQFRAGSASGTATITALSGAVASGSGNSIKILVGTAAVGRVTLNASPALVPAIGGSSTIVAQVFDVNGNALPAAPVSFSTTAGTLNTTIATTDQTGVAQVVLTTNLKATVTASVGASGGTTTTTPPGNNNTTPAPTTPTGTGQASATVVVDVAASPSLVINPPATAPVSGLASVFQFVVTPAASNASPIRSVSVDWGDGSGSQELGAISGTVSVAHTYRSPGTFTISAVITDASGNKTPVSTTVLVNPAALLLTITPPTTPPGAGLPAIFQVVVGTLPAGDTVRNVHLEWGDTKSQDLGAINGSTTVSHVYDAANTYTVTGTLTDTAGNSVTTATSVTVIPVAQPTIIITATVPTTHSSTENVTFQIQISVPTGVSVTASSIDFGDGTSSNLGGATGTITLTHQYSVPVTSLSRLITVTVTDSTGRPPTTGQTTIILP